MLTAERGIEQLTNHVDTLIVIPNQNLFRVANEKTTFAAAFAMADQVLYSGVASITELMTKEGLINLDFADVRAIMSEMGKAMMGTGEATGEKRAIEAAEAAISNPLLDDVSMRGARGLLISITGGPDLTLYEVDEAATRIREEVDPEANIILGATFDDTLEGTMRVSVVATGLALEGRTEAGSGEEPEGEEAEPPRQQFGYYGKQPIPIRKPVTQTAPMMPRAPAAAAAAPAAAASAAPVVQKKVMVQKVEEPEPEEDFEPEEAPVARPQPAARQPRMPAIEEFPQQAQRQYAAQQARIETIAAQATRKRSLFERLAGVGLGRKEDPLPPQPREPKMTGRPEPKMHAPAAAPAKPPVAQHIDPSLDDDQLEIPAFLRRQAN
jgi:cell division protein FtsZ